MRSRWALVGAFALVAVGCTPMPPGGTPGDGTRLGDCPVFPSDNAWNQDISQTPVHANSAAYLANIAAHGGDFLHADFGGGGEYGIPFTTVDGSQPPVAINYTAYGDESDPGPFPIPLSAPVENGSDRHVITVDTANCTLYELYAAEARGDHWDADSGARFDLQSNALRPLGLTSADAAGLPIFAGLARYDEVAAGAIHHALRVTVNHTQRGYILPATHFASSDTDAAAPPMGLRMRLRGDFDTSGYHGQARVILDALKKYGLIVADNGSNWFITGGSDTRWDDDDLNQLKAVPAAAFEAVDTGPVHT